MHWIEKKVHSRFDKACWEYKMATDDDKVLVAVSGGGDSMTLLYLLAKRMHIYSKTSQLYATYVDAGFGDNAPNRIKIIQDYCDELGVPVKIHETEIGPYSHSDANTENPCFLCSRIRRKKIFETAEEFGCNKIAFGHHRDDIVETLMMNMIFQREISTMIPYLPFFDGKYIMVRPMVYIEEKSVKTYHRRLNLPKFDQECPTDGNSKRQYVKELLDGMEHDFKGTRENIFASMRKVKNDYLL